MKVLWIWIAAFILTFVSGLYILRTLTFGTLELRLGFPFYWLVANRMTLPEASWNFTFLWSWFIVDFAIYVLVITTAAIIYEKKLILVSNRDIYRISFLLLNVILVICSWVFIIWISSIDFLLLIPQRSLAEYNINLGIGTWLRFLLGIVTIISTWFLIKHFKRTSTP